MDGVAFGRMIVSASAAIELKKQKINELNVFPVPDGDTGTNMSMTLGAAATELRRKSCPAFTLSPTFTFRAMILPGRGAVSYTHLDVYKRQFLRGSRDQS